MPSIDLVQEYTCARAVGRYGPERPQGRTAGGSSGLAPPLASAPARARARRGRAARAIARRPRRRLHARPRTTPRRRRLAPGSEHLVRTHDLLRAQLPGSAGSRGSASGGSARTCMGRSHAPARARPSSSCVPACRRTSRSTPRRRARCRRARRRRARNRRVSHRVRNSLRRTGEFVDELARVGASVLRAAAPSRCDESARRRAEASSASAGVDGSTSGREFRAGVGVRTAADKVDTAAARRAACAGGGGRPTVARRRRAWRRRAEEAREAVAEALEDASRRPARGRCVRDATCRTLRIESATAPSRATTIARGG